MAVTAGGLTVTAGGLLVTGGATINDLGLVVTAGGLTVAAGDVTIAGNLNVGGNVVATSFTPSDRRLKTDIVPLDAALDKINQLRGMKYSWINKPTSDKGGMFDKRRHVGVFAQDVEAVLPEAVSLHEGFGDGAFLMVEYQALIPLLIEAVRELSAANIHGSLAHKNNVSEMNVLAAAAAAAAASAPSNDIDQKIVIGGVEEQHSNNNLAAISAAVKLLQDENKVLREAVTALQRGMEQLHRRCDDLIVAPE